MSTTDRGADTARDRWGHVPPTPTLAEADRRALLAVAEEEIRARLERRHPDYAELGPLSADLAAHRASFVTLRDGGELLGCIGSMSPTRALLADVAANAVAAAFADPRMPALRPDQFASMEVKVSVLSNLAPMAVRSIEELTEAVEPGIDGLLVTTARHRGTFLPSVWEQMRSAREFLGMLWQKAGMRPFDWPADLSVDRYRTLEFGDPGPRPSISA